MASALVRGEWSASCPEEGTCSLDGRLGGPQNRYGNVERRKLLTPQGLKLGMVNETIQFTKPLIYFIDFNIF
jgi:hypothetical protein